MRSELRELKSLAGPFPDFDPCDVPASPEALFAIWLREAIAADVIEPHAMALSTVDVRGAPDTRMLILKGLDARGWAFATSGESVKARQIAANSQVALTFYWPALGRQVRILGLARRGCPAESAEDFKGRSREAQAIALVGRQSEVLTSDRDLDHAIETARRKLDEEPDAAAPNWALYVVAASEVEFWQASIQRRHVRMRYDRETGGWSARRLWP